VKCDKLGDHRIKLRKSSMGANLTLLNLFFRITNSPLLVATSPCAKIDLRSTGHQNGGRETGSTVRRQGE